MKKSAICQILSDLCLWNPPVNPSTPSMAVCQLHFIHPVAVDGHMETVTHAILLTKDLTLCFNEL